jgi:AcrR family transcriptional regulator
LAGACLLVNYGVRPLGSVTVRRRRRRDPDRPETRRHELALVAPERVVLNVEPGEWDAAGCASGSIKRLIESIMGTPPAARRPAKPKDDRRQALVQAAFNEIAERGFEGLRTREVAAGVGVNIATLHYYFPTKEALIRGVLDLSMQRFRSTLAPHGSAADQLRNHLRAVRQLLRDEPQLGAVMAELALRSARDPAIAGIMEETNEAWHRTVRGLLRRAAREGHLRPELDSDDVAAIVVATLTSMTLPAVAGAARADQAIRQLERWLGIAAPEPGLRTPIQATD